MSLSDTSTAGFMSSTRDPNLLIYAGSDPDMRWISTNRGESWELYNFNHRELRFRGVTSRSSFSSDFLERVGIFITERQFNESRSREITNSITSPDIQMRRADSEQRLGAVSPNIIGKFVVKHPLKGPKAIETRVYCNDCIQVYSLHNNDKCPSCGSFKYKIKENGLDIFDHRESDVTNSNTTSTPRSQGMPGDFGDYRWHLMDNNNNVIDPLPYTGLSMGDSRIITSGPSTLTNTTGPSFSPSALNQPYSNIIRREQDRADEARAANSN